MWIQTKQDSRLKSAFDGSKGIAGKEGTDLVGKTNASKNLWNTKAYQIATFSDAERWAEEAVAQLKQDRITEAFRGGGTYRLLEEVYIFTHAMEAQGKIKRIHRSCVERMPAVRWQERSSYAIILLLLALKDDQLINCSRRYVWKRALETAKAKGVQLHHLKRFLMLSGGIDRAS